MCHDRMSPADGGKRTAQRSRAPGRNEVPRPSVRGRAYGETGLEIVQDWDLCFEVEVGLLAVAGITQGQRGGRK
jgi:hypothetical protein